MKKNRTLLFLLVLMAYFIVLVESCSGGTKEKKQAKQDVPAYNENEEQKAKKNESRMLKMKANSRIEKLKRHFASIDTNNDEKFDKKEFAAHFEGEFDEKDANKDGKLDKNECGMLKEFDTDKDGYVSRKEFSKGHENMFDELDLNNDGIVTLDEFIEAKMQAEAGK